MRQPTETIGRIGSMTAAPDLVEAARIIDLAHSVVEAATTKLASGSIEDNQVLAYELAHAAATVETGRSLLSYGAKGDLEARITCAYIADSVGELAAKLFGREALWGVEPGVLDGARGFTADYRDPAFLAALAFEAGPRHLDDDYEMVQDTFRRFADDRIKPIAEEIHRHNLDIPDEVIFGLVDMGGFGLSVPEEYGGFSSGGEGEYLAMVVATEELAKGSLCVGGSLITRPEILTRALVAGGTDLVPNMKHELFTPPRVVSLAMPCSSARATSSAPDASRSVGCHHAGARRARAARPAASATTTSSARKSLRCRGMRAPPAVTP